MMLIGAILWTTYIIVTLVNVWCIGVMFILLLDGAVGERLERRTALLEREAKRARLRYIKGGKDDPRT